MNQPRFSVIKEHIIRRIDRMHWKAGDRVPSENQLADEFSVSRMTARRALKELEAEGVLVRNQGLGSFVADNRPTGSMLTIRSIDEEIADRGQSHHAEVSTLQRVAADERAAALLRLEVGDPLYHSVLLHFENRQPLQYEERLVNPRFAPDYLKQDFRRITPSRYLSKVAPLTEADQAIEAVRAGPEIASLLRIRESGPCLKLKRRTWCRRGIVNIATLVYPGHRYRITAHLNF